eukprot:14883378-Heterocapsa_arctica.AAC.1
MSIIVCPLVPTSIGRPMTPALVMSNVMSAKLRMIPNCRAASWDSSPGQLSTSTWANSISPIVPFMHSG